ncbi:MAG: hypothetical protein JXP36_17360 [Bacteroidales bacterium]|nr:hypothetical protein [Bacteroidales bacterium]
MKYPVYILIVFTAVSLVASCSHSTSSKLLPPLEIEIPTELEHNPEIVGLIENLENTINEFSTSAQELAKDYKHLTNKNEEDLTVFDKVKLVTVLVQYTEDFSEFSGQYSKLIEQTGTLEDGLNEEQKLALATIMDTFKNRMEQIEYKYKDLTTK